MDRTLTGSLEGATTMGIYLNPGDGALREARRSKIYVDKSMLIAYLNSVVRTSQKYVCVSRPRRFGKTMAADMVCAYYDRTVDGTSAFAGLKVSDTPDFEVNRNRYDVICLNMTEFLQHGSNVSDMLSKLTKRLVWDLQDEYPDVRLREPEDLPACLESIYVSTRRQFVFVIDEWDCLMRETNHATEAQRAYLDFLRALLKDKQYVALAYMTGILPIKKYGKHSALNMFSEFSMTDADVLAPTMGFTDAEVRTLCEQWGMPYDETRSWYNGYELATATGFGETSSIDVYSPRSIVEAMTRHAFGDYWNKTETFEALRVYIDMNYAGLRDDVIALMAGDRRTINVGTFSNDMTTFVTADDVLTLLVHLGYLAYDQMTREVFVPNREVGQEFINATSVGGWDEVARAIQESTGLLEAIVAGDEVAVARGIEMAHQVTSHLSYNSEEALAYTLSLGLYAARQWYEFIRELPTGKGFADLVLVPRRAYADRPAIVVELKWNQTADTALRQIHDKRYPDVLTNWLADGGRVILVGVSYDRKTREHSCKIEELKA
jgi:hypothetical protein